MMSGSVQYKRNEDRIVQGIQAYVDATYGQHYAGSNNRDVVDDWEDCGIAKEAFQSIDINSYIRDI